MSDENKFILNRNYVLQTTLGHSVQFIKGVPTHVPPNLRAAVIGIGAVPADGSDPDVLQAPRSPHSRPIDPNEAYKAVQSAIELIVQNNERYDFTAAGVPTVDAVSKLLGWRATSRDIAAVWAKRGEEEETKRLNP